MSGPMFTTETGRPMDRVAVLGLVRRMAERAGIASAARTSPHSLRHAFATAAREGARSPRLRHAVQIQSDGVRRFGRWPSSGSRVSDSDAYGGKANGVLDNRLSR